MAQRSNTTLRRSEEVKRLLEQVSPNETAAIHALVFLGADRAGLDLHAVQADIRRTLSNDLPEPVYTALQAVYQRVRLGTPSPTDRESEASDMPERQTVGTSNEPDPFTSVGFDFD